MKSSRRAQPSPNQSTEITPPVSKAQRLPWWYTALVGVFVLLAVFLRVWHLDRVPTGIVMDEFDYVLNAKFIYHTGTNIFDNWSPWSLSTFPDEVPKGELTYLVSLPFVGPFGLSLFTARIGFAIISVFSVIISFAIASTLFGPWVGLVTGFMTAINPWNVYFGRTAYDVPVSVTFYLLALLGMLKLKGPKLLLTLLPLFFAFYGYIGMKLLFVPFVIISALGAWLTVRKRQDTIWFVLLILGACLMFGHFVFRVQTTTANLRMNQLFTPFDPKIASAVDEQRRLSLSSPLTNVFANKPVVYVKELGIKFLGAFSPSILFTNGEGMATFALWQHGLFYPIDAVFLLLGAIFLYIGAGPLLLFFAAIIAISPMPSLFSTEGTTYVHRSSLMYPFLTILMSYGLVHAANLAKRYVKTFVIATLIITYIILTANFVFLYFYRFPYYNSESFGLSQRLYSKYASLANVAGVPVTNLTDAPQLYFRNFLLYGNIPNEQTIPSIRTVFKNTDNFSWEHASFTKTCPVKTDITEGAGTYIISNSSPCKELFINKPMITIASLSDGGSLYNIFNDRVCSKYALGGYPTGFTMDDFDVERLSEEQFCTKFVIRYSNPLYQPQGRDGSWIKPQ